MRKLILLLVILIVVFVQGCVKTTVDLDKISDKVGISPSYVLAAVKGDVDLGDIVEPNDTIFFDDLGLMTVVFKEDSIINFAMEDFYESFPTGTLTESFIVPPTFEVLLDTAIDIAYGSDFRLREISILDGSVGYSVTSTCSYNTTLIIQFPGVGSGGSPLERTIPITGAQTVSGDISLDGVLADLTTHPDWDYNALELEFRIIPYGIVSDLPGTVSVEVSMEEPQFDYVKGYFGQQTEDSEAETIDLDMEELFSKISGDFMISSPKITVNYSNSFGIPLRVEALATGKNSIEEIDLERAPVDLLYPETTAVRDIDGSFTIDKTNSKLPELVSMLPNEILFSGSASSNPEGDTEVNNIIFGDSRFIAGIEIEVPMEFWINNLQLTDTIDNFFLSEDGEESDLDIISDLELRMFIDNGFPLGGSMSITPYDSLTNTVSSAGISTGDFFEPADVDANGRVTTSSEKSTTISMTEPFIDDAGEFDKMIVTFSLFTTNNGAQDVKLYSDYRISFKAAVALKAELQ